MTLPPAGGAPPLVSILIVNYNGGPLLARCVASLPAAADSLSFEAIVVDNASTDDSLARLAQLPQLPTAPWLTIIRRADNVGFAAATNQAAATATGDLLLLLNPDTECRPGSIRRLALYLSGQDPRTFEAVAAVGPRLVNADGSPQRSAWRGFPGLRSALVDAFYLWKWPALPLVRGLETRLPDGDSAAAPLDVDHLLGACVLIPRPVWQRVGPLDEGYFLFLEETDWCHRAKAAGYRIVLLPKAEGLHHGQHSVYQVPELSSPSYYRGYLRFAGHAGASPARLLLLRLILLAGILIRLLLWTARLAGGRRTLAGRMLRGYRAALRVVLSPLSA